MSPHRGAGRGDLSREVLGIVLDPAQQRRAARVLPRQTEEVQAGRSRNAALMDKAAVVTEHRQLHVGFDPMSVSRCCIRWPILDSTVLLIRPVASRYPMAKPACPPPTTTTSRRSLSTLISSPQSRRLPGVAGESADP
jgi:hypothetical protein